jgi:hypothetical protein
VAHLVDQVGHLVDQVGPAGHLVDPEDHPAKRGFDSRRTCALLSRPTVLRVHTASPSR